MIPMDVYMKTKKSDKPKPTTKTPKSDPGKMFTFLTKIKKGK